jgi:putative acetyltransferase
MGACARQDAAAAVMKMQIAIRPDDLSGSDIQALIAAHLQNASLHSPPQSMHALNVAGLRAPDLTFWSVWDGPVLLGCGALKALDQTHGEIKSMHTVQRFRGRGIGARMLEHIIAEAGRRGYRRLSLETGSMQVFAPARALYGRYGFRDCPPFGDYRADPYSTFMTLELPSSEKENGGS